MIDWTPIHDLVLMIMALLPLLFFWWWISYLFPRSSRWFRKTGRSVKAVELVTDITADVATHRCPNCGVNDVESDEPWEVCDRCRKEPSWWMDAGVA